MASSVQTVDKVAPGNIISWCYFSAIFCFYDVPSRKQLGIMPSLDSILV